MNKNNLAHDYYATNSVDGLKKEKHLLKGSWLSRLFEYFDITNLSTPYRLVYENIYGKQI